MNESEDCAKKDSGFKCLKLTSSEAENGTREII